MCKKIVQCCLGKFQPHNWCNQKLHPLNIVQQNMETLFHYLIQMWGNNSPQGMVNMMSVLWLLDIDLQGKMHSSKFQCQVDIGLQHTMCTYSHLLW